MPTTMSPIDALRIMGIAEDTYGPTINTTRCRAGVDILGESLANMLRPQKVTILLVWSTTDEAVLAHSTAHYLGAEVVRASEMDGVLSLNGELAAGSRVAVFATRWHERRLAALRRLVTRAGRQSAAVAAILDSPAMAAVNDVPATALIPSNEAEEFCQ